MRLLLLTLLASGCGQGLGGADLGTDLAVPDLTIPDLAQPDLRPSPPDLLLPDCVDNDGGVAQCPMVTGTIKKQFVVNSLQVPQQRADYAYDLNGDGKPDNQFGNIIGALAAQNIDSQTPVDSAIAGGTDVILIDEISGDATFTTDACAASSVYPGINHGSPKFDGTDVFAIDPSKQPAGLFRGSIFVSGCDSAPPPQTAGAPVKLLVRLPLFGSLSPLEMTLTGAHLKYKLTGNNLMQGQINGAVRKAEVDHSLIPQMAANFDALAQTGTSQGTQLLAIFDTGGDPSAACGATCQNLDGSCAASGDHMISDCEVATNAIIKNVLAPDVQMCTAGRYAPSAANSVKDSLSIGLAFTAVPATF